MESSIHLDGGRFKAAFRYRERRLRLLIDSEGRAEGQEVDNERVSGAHQATMWIIDKALAGYETSKKIRSMLRKERKFALQVPLSTRLKMWRKGFLSESFIIYNLKENDPKLYVTDYQRFMKARGLNNPYTFITQNKLVFPRMFLDYTPHLVKNLLLYRQGRFHRLESGPATSVSAEDVIEILKREGKVVAKPLARAGGAEIWVFEIDPESNRISINGEQTSEKEVKDRILNSRGCFICEFVEQADYARRIFPGSANTIRFLTMWDYEIEEPFIAIAVHRFGNKDTIPVDNWSQGGLSSNVDLDTGRLGPGIPFPKDSKHNWQAAHPDTAEPINGVIIPRWDRVREGILDMASRIPFCPYVGWDVIVTNDGFKVLEGNSFTDLNLIQIHRPLLTDERVRRFFQHHHVL